MPIFLPLLLLLVSQTVALDVYILAGQSNMSGFGILSDLPRIAPDLVNPVGVERLQVLAKVDGRRGIADTIFGPELSFGIAISQAQPGKDILLVKYSYSGSSLSLPEDPAWPNITWLPPSLAGDFAHSGSLYQGLFSGTTASIYTTAWIGLDSLLRQLRAENAEVRVRTFVWMQGESDAMWASTAAQYHSTLKLFFNDVRYHLGQPDLPIVLGLIRQEPWMYSAVVRQAQCTLAEQDGAMAWVETNDLPVWTSNLVDFNGAHFNSEGNVLLGRRMAVQTLRIQDLPRQSVLHGKSSLPAAHGNWFDLLGRFVRTATFPP